MVLLGHRQVIQLLLTLVKVTVNLRSKKLAREVERLHDDVIALKMAIEEAIIKGQKSLAGLNDIPEPGLVSNEDFALTCVNAGSRTAARLADY